MSNSRSSCQFFTPFLIEGKEFGAVSDIEHHQAFKKPRISEVGSDSTMAGRRYRWLHYKTRLCSNFKRGRCHYGEACLYAHGVEELRNTLGGSQNEKGVLGRTEYGNHGICDRLKLCKMFSNQGRCEYGEKCRFRHVILKRIKDDESVITISAGGSEGSINGGYGQFGGKRSLGLDVDTNGGSGGRHFRQHGSVAVGRGMLSNTCIASESFADEHAVLRKLCGYTTAETKYSKTYTISREMQVRDGKFDWNELEKMSRIYADWIEEIPLVHRKVQC
ncbi:PREDICTED: zinc finger CCCH domain-containing protein 39-like isoform X2 [Fragaria vesca subsp. vesca]|uniref:zinc finger CCCH domain-containing protein 39-like isoform X2 n=1 Tax=Fragaria vesca subsp. vesca TaxID=101020 RepID=UPI0002C2E8F5|nr:PREDICTED: zinc finger CCCH domain-containing protein 39-like isoform X2 [Fragaria vesca subsp. vesca]